jgi:hypothetical protein
MPQERLLTQVAAVLNEAGIDYVVTGSIVTSVYGEPRYTHDVDIVVAADPRLGAVLAGAFPAPRYYADARDIEESLRKGVVCNLIDSETARKVNFHPFKNEPFDRSFFGRRRKVVYDGVELWFPTPEDAILSKLRWARATGDGDRHICDAFKVYELQYERLDLGYIDEWAAKLRLVDLLERVKKGISG